MLSARASGSGTPREPQHAWATPREPAVGFGNGGGTLKTAGLNLSGVRRGVDPAPSVRSGGRPGDLGEYGVMLRRGLQHDLLLPTPRTPEGRSNLRERHRQRSGHGEITRHWGLKEVLIPDPGEGYGIKNFKGEDVAENFKSGQVLGVAEYAKTRGEAIYHSTVREPLGNTYLRGHSLPPETAAPEFPGFGARRRTTGPAKDTMYPRCVEPESEEARRQYCKTHGSYHPGEVATRGYNWPKAVTEDPHFRFGTIDAVDTASRGAGVKSALVTDRGDEPLAVPNTCIGTHALERKRNATGDHLGRSRNLLTGKQPVPPGHAYGQRTNDAKYGVGDLLRGWYSAEEQEPDVDLGTCIVPGRRNTDGQRAYGIPTVRTDLLPYALHPDRRAVTNSTNFGDDPNADHLIYPGKFRCQGISDEDFCQRRGRDELQSILHGAEGAGYALEHRDFEQVFQMALGLHGDGGQEASAEALMAAYFQFTGSPQR